MKINNKIYKATLAVFLLLAAVLSYFRYDMLKDNKVIDRLGLYTDKAYGNTFGIFVFVLIALTVVFAFLLSKSAFAERKSNVLCTVSSAICMLLLLSAGISGFHELLMQKKLTEADFLQVQATPGFNILLVLETIFAFASVAFFLKDTLRRDNPDGEQKYSVLALIPVIYLAIRTIKLFMNTETQINASGRSFTLLFLVVTMMFFICETEYSVPLGSLEKTDEAASKRAAKYIGFGLVSAELALIFVLMPMLAGYNSLYELMYGISDLSLALFAIVRIFSAKING